MSDIHIVKVLVLNKTPEEGKSLSELLTETGFPCDVVCSNSLDEFQQLVDSKESNLIVAWNDSSDKVSVEGALKYVRETSSSIPFLIINNHYSAGQVVHWMQAGACDVIADGNNTHMALVMGRETGRTINVSDHSVENEIITEPEEPAEIFTVEVNEKPEPTVIQVIKECLKSPQKERENLTLFIVEVMDWVSLSHKYGKENEPLICQALKTEFLKYINSSATCEVVEDRYFYILENAPRHSPEGIATKITQGLDQLFIDIADQSFQVGVALAVIPLKYSLSSMDEVMARARELVSNATAEGINKYDMYCPLIDLERQAKEGDSHALVQHALDNNGFKLLFQPVASLAGETNELYDVLLRVMDPNGKEVSAGRFIGAIDKTPLAEKIDKWVILQSIRRLLESRQKEKMTHLFIHLSSATIQDKKFLPWLYLLIKKARISPEKLVFQLTEESVVRYKDHVHHLLAGLGKIGCQTSLCQYGTTSNPMRIAQSVNTDYVKLSGKLTDDLNGDQPEKEKEFKDLIQALQGQGKKTIVPNIENPNVMTKIWRTGSDFVQGYFLQKPKPDMDYDFSSD